MLLFDNYFVFNFGKLFKYYGLKLIINIVVFIFSIVKYVTNSNFLYLN